MSDINKYIEEINKFPVLTEEEEKKLFENKRNITAREKIITAHLRNVVAISKLFLNKGVALEDLIEEGIVGLLVAFNQFDINRGVKFISYASWWIRHYIYKLICIENRIVERPTSYLSKKTIFEMEKDLAHKFGRLPSDEELSRALNVSAKEIRKAMQFMLHDYSLNTAIRGEEVSLLDFIDTNEDIESEFIKKMITKEIMEKIELLKKKEREVIELRFGLIDGKHRTLQEVGEKMGLSRERVRQIQAKAISKIRKGII